MRVAGGRVAAVMAVVWVGGGDGGGNGGGGEGVGGEGGGAGGGGHMAAARVARVSPRVTSFGGARLDFPIICMGRMARLFPYFYWLFFRITAEPVSVNVVNWGQAPKPPVSLRGA